MADHRSATRRRLPPPRTGPTRRPPQTPSRVRNSAIIAIAALAAVGVILWAATRDDDPTDGPGGLTGNDFHSIVADPTDPDRLFVGGHTAVSVSTDGGATWTEVATLRDADAMGWALTNDAIYVSGHPGLNRSTDGGMTFQRINQGLPDTDVHAFGGTDDVLYGASPAVGVFASTTGPGTWELRTDSVGHSFFGRIVVDPADHNHLLAADASAGVAESTNGGRTWQLLDSGLPAATWLSHSAGTLDLLVASGPAGAALSTDGGRTWAPLTLPDGATLVEVAPDDTLYAGIHRDRSVEVQVSTDRGRTWTAR